MDIELSLDGSGPLYEQIKRAIATPIRAGKLRPGQRIPSEHEMVALFGTSRMTVNRALSALAADGLVVRRRRNGTFVARQSNEHSVLEIAQVRMEVERADGRYSYQRISRRVVAASTTTTAQFGAATGKKILQLVGLHLADEQPFVLEQRLINLAAVPKAAAESFLHEPPGAWLLAHVPWSEAKHVIHAENADGDIARRLQLKPGSACLVVERRTVQAGLPITFVRLSYPGDRHKLVGRFTPGA